jgi:hypothetical protein
MQFEWVREGGDCRDRCRTWIAASGKITETSAADFEAFGRGFDLRGAMVVLDSGGGVVEGGLALGRAFRRLGLTTTIGRTMRLPPSLNGERRAMLSPRASCASMCVFALLGGARRHVPDEARVLVHQIWPSKLREDALVGSYTAGNMVRIQRELGLIARYTIEMGADIELFELAMRIPPWETLRPLSRQELLRMRVHNADAAVAAIGASAPEAKMELPVQRVALAAAMAELPRGWTVTRQGGRSVLSRRHPLTVEGQEIGSFELAFACSATPDAFQVIYRETRLADAAKPDRLSGVRMTIQRERLLLRIDSSAPAQPTELVSSARGVVPAELARMLGEANGPSLMVETATVGNQRTGIRIGPAGLAEGFREIAAGCTK